MSQPLARPAVRRFGLDICYLISAAFIALFASQRIGTFWNLHVGGAVLSVFCGSLLLAFLQMYRLRSFPTSDRDWMRVGSAGLGVFGIGSVFGAVFNFDLPLAFGLSLGGLFGSALLVDRYRLSRVALVVPAAGKCDRAIVIGAGAAAEMLLRELRTQRPTLEVIGLLDDDRNKVGSERFGVRVLGPIDRVGEIASRENVSEIIVAIPSLDAAGQKRVLDLCRGVGAKLKMMPLIARQLAEGGHALPVLRDVAPEELLRRDSIETDMSAAAGYIGGATVMITGGGGSIGSELGRQIASLLPGRIVLFGKGENSIFEAELDLKQRGFTEIVPVIGDVRDRASVDRAMREYKPDVVFHAAAHKHVPLMERVPIEAVRNNVFGTLNAAESAMAHGVRKFILISTDKAVNPTNVMGATKRAAEIAIMALAGQSATQFAAVRFGNVLGSRGSLIPILKNQIVKGGPITITDERMTRFFMTIPEAAQLVIQAGAQGGAGEIFILDMGEPIRIVDVARGLLDLYGLVEGRDIELKFIGARPGEKIHEELSWESEDLERIDGGKILRLRALDRVEESALRSFCAEMSGLCESGDEEGVRSLLMGFVGGESSTAGVLRVSPGS
jgi:FlaA1/EpsC-like NDP-sugar epimerase